MATRFVSSTNRERSGGGLRRGAPVLPLLILTSSSLLAVPAVAVEPDARWEVQAKLPAFVDDTPLPKGRSRDSDVAVRWLLSETQTRVTEETVVGFVRYAIEIREREGLEEASEIRIEFDPSHQRLELHRVRLHRSGERLDALADADLNLIQRERALDHLIYDGTLTAVVFVKNVRVGDVIEVAFSRVGWPATLAGHFMSELPVGGAEPVDRFTHRLILPADWTLQVKKERTEVEPTHVVEGREQTWTWQVRDARTVPLEDRIPSWFAPYPRVKVSTFSSWAAVADWARPLYQQPDGPPAPTVQAVVDRLKHNYEGAEVRLLGATTFVQRDIRYLGIELGEGGVKPRAPGEVLARRYGDCKDKSLLLVALLKGLGIAAEPVLVHSEKGARLHEELPSPAAFDHVIVLAWLGRSPVWIDATNVHPVGSLRDLAPPKFVQGLVIREGVTSLSAIERQAPSVPEIVVTERIRPGAGKDAELECVTRYHGHAARRERLRLTRVSRAEMERLALNFYARQHPDIEQAAPLDVRDEPATGALVVTERYRLPSFWAKRRLSFALWGISSRLVGPEIVRRQAPFQVTNPPVIRHEIYVHTPRDLGLRGDEFTAGDATISYRLDVSYAERVLHLKADLETHADFVPASHVRAHADVLDDIRQHAGYSVELSSEEPGFSTWLEYARDSWALETCTVCAGGCGGAVLGMVVSAFVPCSLRE